MSNCAELTFELIFLGIRVKRANETQSKLFINSVKLMLHYNQFRLTWMLIAKGIKCDKLSSMTMSKKHSIVALSLSFKWVSAPHNDLYMQISSHEESSILNVFQQHSKINKLKHVEKQLPFAFPSPCSENWMLPLKLQMQILSCILFRWVNSACFVWNFRNWQTKIDKSFLTRDDCASLKLTDVNIFPQEGKENLQNKMNGRKTWSGFAQSMRAMDWREMKQSASNI